MSQVLNIAGIIFGQGGRDDVFSTSDQITKLRAHISQHTSGERSFLNFGYGAPQYKLRPTGLGVVEPADANDWHI